MSPFITTQGEVTAASARTHPAGPIGPRAASNGARVRAKAASRANRIEIVRIVRKNRSSSGVFSASRGAMSVPGSPRGRRPAS
jgi:hypothetical protein